jgi:hypothetical protein
MARFQIRFLKRVCNDIGHECVTCQGEFAIEGASAGQALEDAETTFCEARRTNRWDLFADTVEIRLAGASEHFVSRRTSVTHSSSGAV